MTIITLNVVKATTEPSENILITVSAQRNDGLDKTKKLELIPHQGLTPITVLYN